MWSMSQGIFSCIQHRISWGYVFSISPIPSLKISVGVGFILPCFIDLFVNITLWLQELDNSSKSDNASSPISVGKILSQSLSIVRTYICLIHSIFLIFLFLSKSCLLFSLEKWNSLSFFSCTISLSPSIQNYREMKTQIFKMLKYWLQNYLVLSKNVCV